MAIIEILGPLKLIMKSRYVDEYTRQAHIDYILPRPQITSDAAQ